MKAVKIPVTLKTRLGWDDGLLNAPEIARRAEAAGISIDEARRKREASIPAGRYGTAEEFGATCAFLCSQFAGFIVGQNILLDGGNVNATI